MTRSVTLFSNLMKKYTFKEKFIYVTTYLTLQDPIKTQIECIVKIVNVIWCFVILNYMFNALDLLIKITFLK